MFSRFSPIVAVSLLASLLFPASSLLAGASNKNGSPFGNGTFFPDSGTFSAVIRGSNAFLGVMEFTTSDGTETNRLGTNALGNVGTATVYANGEQFVGPAFGTISGSTIAATYQGAYSYGVFVPTQTVNTNGTTNTTYTSQSLTNTVSGQFTANLYNSYPTQGFTGNGEAGVSLTQLNQTNFSIRTVNTTYYTSVSGSRLTSGQ